MTINHQIHTTTSLLECINTITDADTDDTIQIQNRLGFVYIPFTNKKVWLNILAVGHPGNLSPLERCAHSNQASLPTLRMLKAIIFLV